MNIPTEFYVRAAETGMPLEEVRAHEKAAELDALPAEELLAGVRAVVQDTSTKTASPKGLRAAMGIKEAINPNFDIGALKNRLANRGKPPAMSGFGLGKGVSDMSPGFSTAYETVNKTRATGGNVLGALLGAKKASVSAAVPLTVAGGAIGAGLGAARAPEGKRLQHGAAGGLAGAGVGFLAGKAKDGHDTGKVLKDLAFGKKAAWDGQRLKDVATDALVRGGVGAAIATGGVLAHRGLTGLADKMTAGRDKQRLLDTDPRLGGMGSPEQIDLAYNSLRRFAPHVTKDPLAGANSLRAILSTKDPHDPSAPPRLSGASLAQELGKIAPQPSAHERILSDAFMSGTQSAFRHSDDAAAGVSSDESKMNLESFKDRLSRGRDNDLATARSTSGRHEANVNALFNELKTQGYSDDYINALLQQP